MKDTERFVEAHLLGVELSETPRLVKLMLRESNGTRFSLTAFNVHRLLVSELRETNIVDHLSVWDSSVDPDAYRAALCELVSGNEDQQDVSWKQLIDAEMKAVRDGARVFASIEAVYGAQILMLAERIVISQ